MVSLEPCIKKFSFIHNVIRMSFRYLSSIDSDLSDQLTLLEIKQKWMVRNCDILVGVMRVPQLTHISMKIVRSAILFPIDPRELDGLLTWGTNSIACSRLLVFHGTFLKKRRLLFAIMSDARLLLRVNSAFYYLPIFVIWKLTF